MAKPKIRFKGYQDDWEQRKVGDITKELSEYAKLSSGLPLLTSARTGLMYQSDYRGNSTTDNENTLFSIVPLNACTYRHMSDDSTFHINVNTLEKGLVSKEYPVFVENESDLRFVVQYINSSDSFTKFCTEQKKGGTRTRLYYKTLCEYKMLIPSLNEQHIIADYFDNLDSLITLHQRKCDEAKKIKKFMLQKMFPQNGSRVPEIRFDGFTDDWEQRKLRDVLTLLKDGTHGTHKDTESGPLLLSAKNIKNGIVQWDESDRRISVDEYKSIHANFELQDGDVLLTIVGSIGETAILSHSEGITFQRSVAFLRPSNEIISEFLYSEIQGHEFQKELNDRKSTSAQPGIYLGDLGEIPINYPINIDEQTAIGQCFTTLDHLITLHQQKCTDLKNLKKYMLQNMFI